MPQPIKNTIVRSCTDDGDLAISIRSNKNSIFLGEQVQQSD